MSDLCQPRQITVHASNFDGSPHWVHPATLVSAEGGLVITATEAGLPIARETSTFVSPYNTRGHYWPDCWFNVIRLELPGRGLYGYYCNVATPVEFDGSTVRYMDLQLDVLVTAAESGALSFRIADEDEFELARDRYGYDDTLVRRSYEAVDRLVAMIEAREFPFDG
jgi:uncharacterized protein